MSFGDGTDPSGSRSRRSGPPSPEKVRNRTPEADPSSPRGVPPLKAGGRGWKRLATDALRAGPDQQSPQYPRDPRRRASRKRSRVQRALSEHVGRVSQTHQVPTGLQRNPLCPPKGFLHSPSGARRDAAGGRDRAVAPRGVASGRLADQQGKAGRGAPWRFTRNALRGLHLARRRTTRQGIELCRRRHRRLHQMGSVNPLIPVVDRPL